MIFIVLDVVNLHILLELNNQNLLRFLLALFKNGRRKGSDVNGL